MKNHYIPENSFPIKIDNNIFMLGNYFFNLFLIVGSRHSALFEVGISAIVDTVITQLEHLGVCPDFIIPSHPHSDHITGLPGLISRYPKSRVIVGSGAKEFIKHPKAAPLLFKEDKFMSNRLADYKITPGRPPLERMPSLEPALAVDDRKSLDLGGITLDLIKVEGHSPGNFIGVLNEKKILFCSDSIGFHFPGRGYLPLFFTHGESYLSTLDFIEKFNPFILCPAHQGPLTDKAATAGIQESLSITRDIITTIRHSHHSDSIQSMDLFKQYYKDEFTLYTPDNIKNCTALLVKRAKEMI